MCSNARATLIPALKSLCFADIERQVQELQAKRKAIQEAEVEQTEPLQKVDVFVVCIQGACVLCDLYLGYAFTNVCVCTMCVCVCVYVFHASFLSTLGFHGIYWVL